MSRNTVDFDDLLASLDDLTSTNTTSFDEPPHHHHHQEEESLHFGHHDEPHKHEESLSFHHEEPLHFGHHEEPHKHESLSFHHEEPLHFQNEEPVHFKQETRSRSSSSSSNSDNDNKHHNQQHHSFEASASVDPLDELLESSFSFNKSESPRHSVIEERHEEEIHLPPPPPPAPMAPPPAPAPSFKPKAAAAPAFKPKPSPMAAKPKPAPVVAKPKAFAQPKLAASQPTPNKPLHAPLHHDSHHSAKVIQNDDNSYRPPAHNNNNNNKSGDMRNFARQSTIITPGSGGGSGGGARGGAGGEHCHKCQQRIDGEYMSALGKSFHTHHFNCHDCGNQLGQQFFEHHGNPICQNCAGNLLPCFKCRRGITGQYMIQDGKPHHKDCIERWVCAGCNRDIDDVATNALGKHWHKHCFVCRQCNKELLGNFVNQNGQPVCDNCSRQSLPRCITCKQEVVGNYTNFDGKAYHNECFKCGRCSTKLQLSGFYNVNGQNLCERCAK